MTSLFHAPAHLARWLEEIDAKIADLTRQRQAFSDALHCFDVEHLDLPATTSTPMPVTAGNGDVAPCTAPVEQRTPTAKRNGRHDIDYTVAARVYIDAVTAGRKPIDALCQHFDVERSAAKNYPERCCKLGLLPPRGEPVVEHDPPPTRFVVHER